MGLGGLIWWHKFGLKLCRLCSKVPEFVPTPCDLQLSSNFGGRGNVSPPDEDRWSNGGTNLGSIYANCARRSQNLSPLRGQYIPHFPVAVDLHRPMKDSSRGSSRSKIIHPPVIPTAGTFSLYLSVAKGGPHFSPAIPSRHLLVQLTCEERRATWDHPHTFCGSLARENRSLPRS